jgi:uncharacterized protein YyaL (SSP411 family)
MQIVIVRGDAAQAEHWAESLHARYAPTRMIFAVPREAADLPRAIAEKRATADTVAYACRGMTCSAPLGNLSEIERELARAVCGG